MIPLQDSVGGQRRPVVTVALIVACGLVFAYELTLRGAALDAFVGRWGAEPNLVIGALTGAVPRTVLLTLLTSQFLHAGFLHLGGNMLFLWVFGRAVEDRLGPLVYFLFYLAAGTLAGLVQCLISAQDTIPLIGASGAIAGVLGLYFLTYPTAWVRVLLPILFFFWTFDLPAVLVLAFWFVTQFFSGIAAITVTQASNVAVWAHVAGFAFGVLAAFVLPNGATASPQAIGFQRENAPGPARLVSSVADLAVLLLAVRLVAEFFGPTRSPVATFVNPILGLTQPVVAPLQGLLPSVRVLGGVVETYTLVAMLLVFVLAGLIGQMFVSRR